MQNLAKELLVHCATFLELDEWPLFFRASRSFAAISKSKQLWKSLTFSPRIGLTFPSSVERVRRALFERFSSAKIRAFAQCQCCGELINTRKECALCDQVELNEVGEEFERDFCGQACDPYEDCDCADNVVSSLSARMAGASAEWWQHKICANCYEDVGIYETWTTVHQGDGIARRRERNRLQLTLWKDEPEVKRNCK
jgi:hypothetical protein